MKKKNIRCLALHPTVQVQCENDGYPHTGPHYHDDYEWGQEPFQILGWIPLYYAGDTTVWTLPDGNQRRGNPTVDDMVAWLNVNWGDWAFWSEQGKIHVIGDARSVYDSNAQAYNPNDIEYGYEKQSWTLEEAFTDAIKIVNDSK